MDQEDEYGGLFLVSVDDLGTSGLWASTKDLLESRSTLHNLVLHNKLGRAVTVDRLTLQFVASGDKRLQRLRPFANSPVVWFRHPYAHLLLVSTVDTSDYRNVIKPALKRAIVDLEHDWGGPPAPGAPPPQPTGMGALLGGSSATPVTPPGVLGAEWLIVYIRPSETDLGDKGAKKVYDKLKDDFSPRGRTRVIRIDPPKGYSAAAVAAVAGAGALPIGGGPSSWATPRGPGAGPGGGGGGPVASVQGLPHGFLQSSILGLDDLEACLRECVRNSFESRQAAYMAEVQRLANERRDPNWSFASLYLVKDSLALLLEGCGLHLEAYKEYVELEAAYQETLDRQQQQQQHQQAQGQHGPQDANGAGPMCTDDAFGASGPGAEVATLTSASWRITRRSVLKRAAVQEFRFRQYLFASQSRLLLRLGRPVDVAEKGLRFIGALAAELGQRERPPAGSVRPLFKEAWTLSACLAVVGAVTASVFGREAAPSPPPGMGSGFGGAGNPLTGSADPSVSGGAYVDSAGAGPRGGSRGARSEAAAPRSTASRAPSQQPETAPSGGTSALLDDEPGDGPTAAVVGSLGPGSVAGAAAPAGHVDWQLCVPFEAEVPSLDISALCGQAIAPGTLTTSRPADAEALLRQVTFQGFVLALAHLYGLALSALVRLAQKAAQLVGAPPSGAAGAPDAGAPPNVDDWDRCVAAYRHGLQELPALYACRTVVGLFVDQEEDHQFEATPQQQATQLQLLRQAISGQVAVGGTAVGGGGAGSFGTASAITGSPLQSQANLITPRGDSSSPAATSAIWLTPTGPSTASVAEQTATRHHHHHRSESLYSVSIAGGPTAPAAAAAAVPAGGPAGSYDSWDSAPAAPASTAIMGSARPAPGAAGMGLAGMGRTQMSWAAEPEMLSSSGAVPEAPGQRRSHHHHSSSADNASGSFLAKLDVFASKVSTALDPTKPPRPGPGRQAAAGMASPRGRDGQAASASVSSSLQHQQLLLLQQQQADSGSAGSPGEGPSAAGAPPAAAVLPPEIAWLQDWRVRIALSSPSYCADLALQLALAAATCYSRAGRQRAAAQLYGDVGAVLLGRGQAEVVAELMEHVVSLSQAEGWYALLGRALPVLMAAQQAIGHVMLPYTCIKYLSLPQLACHVDVRRRVLEHLLTSAGCSWPPDGTGRVRRPPLPSAVLQLSTGQAVQASLRPGWCSKFYGTRSASGAPSLVPPARAAAGPCWRRHSHAHGQSRSHHPSQLGADDDVDGEPRAVQGEGRQDERRHRRCRGGSDTEGGSGGAGVGAAQYLRVGEVCSLELQVYSNLPVAVPLSDLHLVLGTVQPTQAPALLQPPPYSSAHSSHHHSSYPGHHHHAHQQHQTTQQQQPGNAPLQQPQQPQPSAAAGRSYSGTSAQPQPQQGQQQPQLQRPPPSSFSQVQHSTHTHTRNLSGGDLPAVSAVPGAAGSLSAWRVHSGSVLPGGAAGGPAPAAPSASTPALTAPQRPATADLIGSHHPIGSLDIWATQQQQPYGAALPYNQNQNAPQLLHASQSSGLAGVTRPASASGMTGGIPASWGSATSLPQLVQMPNSPTMSHGAGGATGPSRLMVASRGGGGAGAGGGAGGGAAADRPMSSNTSSSLSLGPAAGATGGASYSNVSEASGLGRRAPSWPDTLSAAASYGQGPGVGGLGGMLAAGGLVAGGPGRGGPGVEPPATAGGAAGGLTSPSSTRGGAGSGWAAGDDLTCYHLLEVRHIQRPGKSSSCAGSSGSGTSEAAAAAAAAAASISHPASVNASRTVLLHPGLTRLTFRVAPTRPGLYFARHLSASLGSYDVRIPVVPAAQLAADVRALTGGWNGLLGLGANAAGAVGSGSGAAAGSFTFGGLGLGFATSGAAIAQLGEVADGEVRHLEVVLQVAPLVPRLLAGPVVVGSSLVAGMPQWLGVVLTPLDPDGRREAGARAPGGGQSRSSGGDAEGEGEDGGNEGLQYVRVHVQARGQSALRLGDWFPAPPAATPLGPLSAMPSLPSVGAATPTLTPTLGTPGEFGGPDSGNAAAAAGGGGGGTPNAVTAASTAADPVAAAATRPAGAFASPGGMAAAAAVSAAPSFQHHLHHVHHPQSIMSAPPTYRRGEAGGQCRVAVIDLPRVAAAAAAEPAAAGAGAALPGKSSRTPRPSLSADGPSTGGGGSAPSALKAGEVHWTVSSRQGIDLSQALAGPLRAPVLLWLPVWVPPAPPVVGQEDKAPLDVAPELVRVLQAHAGVASARYGTAGGIASSRSRGATSRPGCTDASVSGREISAGPQQLQPPGHKAQATGQRPLPSLELEVVVEGLDGGLWRSHATSLAVPLQQPFRVRTSAHQLPDTHVLVSVTLTSCLALPVLLTEVVLEPQYGLVLGPDPAGGSGLVAASGSIASASIVSGVLPSLVPGLLPLQLAPNESANWGFVLSRSPEALPALPGLHQDDCCLLHMAFCVVPPPPGAGSIGSPAAHEVLGPALQPVSGYRYPLPPLSATGAPPGDGFGFQGASFTESGTVASSPGGGAYGHGHGYGLSGAHLQLRAAQSLPSPGPGPGPGPGAASGSCCPNIYSHNGAYAAAVSAAVARGGYDSLGGAAAAAAAAASAVQAAAGGGGGFSFTHGFVLEFPPSNALTHNLVSVRLLGPHSAILGQPTHLTWLVTRVSSPPAVFAGTSGGGGGNSASAADDADVAVYEVLEATDGADGPSGGALFRGSAAAVAAAGGTASSGPGGASGSGGCQWQWRQALGCRGSIRLGRAKGSVAVVEAVMLPVLPGLLRVPVLRLRGLREVREEDAVAAEYVMVSAPTGL